MEELRQWYNIFLNWVSDFLKKSEKNEQPKSIETYYSEDKLTKLERFKRETPGEVLSWRLKHVDEINQWKIYPKLNKPELLILLDNVRRFRWLGDNKKTLLTYTHLISIQWHIKLKSGRVVGNVIEVWVGDLQGNKNADPDKAAYDITKYIAYSVLKLKSLPGFNWTKRVNNYPWKEYINDYSKATIGEKHDPKLQRVKLDVIRMNLTSELAQSINKRHQQRNNK